MGGVPALTHSLSLDYLMRTDTPTPILAENLAVISDFDAKAFGCEKPWLRLFKSQLTGELQSMMMRCSGPDKCEKCIKRNKQEWTARLIAERTQYRHSAFLTLTFDDLNLPSRGHGETLETYIGKSYTTVQDFLKRLRVNGRRGKKWKVTYADGNTYHMPAPSRFRYFVSGEIGPNSTQRLHWHLIIFGLRPFPTGQTTDNIWRNGFLHWKPVTVGECAYAACYVQKKNDAHANFYRYSTGTALGDTFFMKLGILAYLHGKPPQTIKSFKTGKSWWPIPRTGRKLVLDGWEKGRALDTNAINRGKAATCQRSQILTERAKSGYLIELRKSLNDGLWLDGPEIGL